LLFISTLGVCFDVKIVAVVCESGASVAARDKFSTADAETQFAVFDNGTINATLIPGAEFVARAREHRHDILECIATRDKTNVCNLFEFKGMKFRFIESNL
jgi:hypothetical protein